jgi:DNA-binding response OmpR family regulator
MKKILVIDDFEDSCQLMAEILSPFYEVKYICQADKAMEFIGQNVPDLIIMDYKMPYVTGVELCKILRETMSTKNIPIIFVSGAATSDERIETLESGGDDFLSKPFHPKELLLRVQKRLSYTIIAPNSDSPLAAPVEAEKIIREMLQVANLKINDMSHKVFLDENEVKLTPKQYDILRLLIDNKNNLVSREKFMKEVWGHSDVTPRNVDSQINYLKKKIEGFQGRITAVPSHGYRLEA